MLKSTIDNFGQRMGFENLDFNEHKVIHLTMEKLGDVYLEDIPPYLLIYVTNPMEKPSLKIFQKALELCHYKQKNLINISVGLYEDDQLAFCTRMVHEDITESNLDKALEFIHRLHEQIKKLEQK